MMLPSNRVRFLVSTRPVDFRKSHDGLAAIVSQVAISEKPKTLTRRYLCLGFDDDT